MLVRLVQEYKTILDTGHAVWDDAGKAGTKEHIPPMLVTLSGMGGAGKAATRMEC